jgi:hypothetical protein
MCMECRKCMSNWIIYVRRRMITDGNLLTVILTFVLSADQLRALVQIFEILTEECGIHAEGCALLEPGQRRKRGVERSFSRAHRTGSGSL